ncbi:hypothetical protein FAI41_03600 [Acetobacteraceae bacterium]|nr:hypothetical protein FAI41_03600 [Acetobacteraceae bacterium]
MNDAFPLSASLKTILKSSGLLALSLTAFLSTAYGARPKPPVSPNPTQTTAGKTPQGGLKVAPPPPMMTPREMERAASQNPMAFANDRPRIQENVIWPQIFRNDGVSKQPLLLLAGATRPKIIAIDGGIDFKKLKKHKLNLQDPSVILGEGAFIVWPTVPTIKYRFTRLEKTKKNGKEEQVNTIIPVFDLHEKIVDLSDIPQDRRNALSATRVIQVEGAKGKATYLLHWERQAPPNVYGLFPTIFSMYALRDGKKMDDFTPYSDGWYWTEEIHQKVGNYCSANFPANMFLKGDRRLQDPCQEAKK